MTVVDLNEADALSGLLLSALDVSRIPYVLLSDPRHLDHPRRDIDIGTLNSRKLLAFLRAFEGFQCLKLVNAVEHATGLRCEFAKVRDRDTCLHKLSLDMIVKLPPALEQAISMADTMAASRLSATGWSVPAPEHAFLYVLYKRLSEQRMDSDACHRLGALWKSAPEASRALVADTLSDASIKAVFGAAKTERWEDLSRLRRGRALSVRGSWERWSQVARLWRRIVEPVGWSIAILGLDGTGKSTLINHLAHELGPVFRGVERYHLTTPTDEQQDRTGGRAPHAAPARGPVGSIAKILWFWLRFHIHSWLRVWPGRIRGRLVLHDRYFHDLLVDPLRYRYAGPQWIARTLARWLPKPDCWIVLDAPVSTIRARKSEIEPELAERHRAAYLHLADRLPGATLIDATARGETVAGQTLERILTMLEGRQEKRFGTSP